MKEEINKQVWEMWKKNFENAKKFFKSKGNIKTRSKLKNKWYNEFFEDLNLIGNELLKGEKK